MPLSFTDEELLERAKELRAVAEDHTGPLPPRARKSAAVSIATEREGFVDHRVPQDEPLVVRVAIEWLGRTVVAQSFAVPISHDEEPT